MSLSRVVPPWPSSEPEYGAVRLRAFSSADARMAMDLSTDPYVPSVGSLPPHATHADALEWIERQRRHHVDGRAFSFAIAAVETDLAVGHIGLWLGERETGRAQIGYGVAPHARGHGRASDALCAATAFAWTIPYLHRLELYVEPWNAASIRTAERAGYEREGLLRSHQEIAGRRRDMLLYAAIRQSTVR